MNRGEPIDRGPSPLVVGLILLTIPVATLPFSFAFQSFDHLKTAALGLCFLALTLASLTRVRNVLPARVFYPLWGLLGISVVLHGVLGLAEVRSFVFERAIVFALPLALAAWAAPYAQELRVRILIRTAWLGTALVVAMLGIAQYFNLLPILFPSFPDYGQPVYSVFGNQNLYGAFLAAALPLALYNALTVHRFGQAVVIMGVLVVALVLSMSRGAWLAAIVGLVIVLPACPKAPRRIAGLAFVALLAAAGTALATSALSEANVWSVGMGEDLTGRLRLWFWDGAARMAVAHPLVGVGLGNFAFHSPEALGDALRGRFGAGHEFNGVHTFHAHNDPLELTAETGVIGAALLALFVVSLRKGRGPEWGPFAALGAFACLNPMLSSTPHLLWMLMSAAALAPPAAPWEHDVPTRLRSVGAVAAAAILLIGVIATESIPSVLRTRVQTVAHERPESTEACEAVLRYPWPMPYALEECGQLALETDRLDDARLRYNEARPRLDTWSLHLALGMLAEEEGKPDEARERFWAAQHRWPAFTGTYIALKRVTPDEEQEALKTEARRWLPEDDYAGLFATSR